MNSASSVPPKPKPSSASGAAAPKTMKIVVPPNRPRPSVNMPVTVPERYAIRSASPKSCMDAAATRMLPCTAMRMPNWPTISEKDAPRMKAIARPKAMMIRALSPNMSIASGVGLAIQTLANRTKTRAPTNGRMVRSWRPRYASAPSLMAVQMRIMAGVPLSSAITLRNSMYA